MKSTVVEPHFSPQFYAELWGVSRDTTKLLVHR